MSQITVLLTVYNGERFLSNTINSLIAQTLDDFRILVIDDGSTDKTLEILSSFDDPRLDVVTQPNKGRAIALNRGLELADTKYVSIIDDDDLAAPKRLEKSIAYLENNPEVDLVAGGYERQYEESDEDSELAIPPSTHDDVIQSLPFRNPFGHSLVTFRKSSVQQLGGYRELDSCVDYDLWVRMAAEGCRFGTIEEVLGTIRKHKDRSYNFEWSDHIQYVRTAHHIRARAARCLELPAYYQAAPYLMSVWSVLPSVVKRIIAAIRT